MGSSILKKGLGTVCLSRSDAIQLFQNTKKSSGRSNLQTQVKNVTKTKLICYGSGESYNLGNVCTIKISVEEEIFESIDSTICTLENGKHLQLDVG